MDSISSFMESLTWVSLQFYLNQLIQGFLAFNIGWKGMSWRLSFIYSAEAHYINISGCLRHNLAFAWMLVKRIFWHSELIIMQNNYMYRTGWFSHCFYMFWRCVHLCIHVLILNEPHGETIVHDTAPVKYDGEWLHYNGMAIISTNLSRISLRFTC